MSSTINFYYYNFPLLIHINTQSVELSQIAQARYKWETTTVHKKYLRVSFRSNRQLSYSFARLARLLDSEATVSETDERVGSDIDDNLVEYIVLEDMTSI